MIIRKKDNFFVIAVFLLLFFIVWFFISTEIGSAVDTKISTAIFDCGHNNFLTIFFLLITNYTLGEIAGVFAVMIYGAFRKDKFFLIISSLVSLLILAADWFLKNIFVRPRPFVTLPEVENISDYILRDYSFPSGHTVFAFFIAYILTHRFQFVGIKKYVIYFLAILVGFSRIYLGVHYLGDVLAGAILGSLFGIMTMLIMNKYPRTILK